MGTGVVLAIVFPGGEGKGEGDSSAAPLAAPRPSAIMGMEGPVATAATGPDAYAAVWQPDAGTQWWRSGMTADAFKAQSNFP